MALRIRQAVPGQGGQVAACMRRCWQESFLSMTPWCLEWFDAHRSGLGEELDSRMADGHHVWLGVDTQADGEVVGFAWAGVNLDGPTPLELESLYLRSRCHGSGLGQALLTTAIGDSPAFLMVIAGNERAKAFYSRNGFAPDGVVDDHTDEYPGYLLERWVRP